MGSRTIERRLRKVSTQLRSLREELTVLDAQIVHFGEEASELATRALVADDLRARPEARDAERHFEKMRAQRQRVVEEIAALEVRQDELLDQLAR